VLDISIVRLLFCRLSAR